jgi:hypothetical protein
MSREIRSLSLCRASSRTANARRSVSVHAHDRRRDAQTGHGARESPRQIRDERRDQCDRHDGADQENRLANLSGSDDCSERRRHDEEYPRRPIEGRVQSAQHRHCQCLPKTGTPALPGHQHREERRHEDQRSRGGEHQLGGGGVSPQGVDDDRAA